MSLGRAALFRAAPFAAKRGNVATLMTSPRGMPCRPDLDTLLLALQHADDVVIHGLEARMAKLSNRESGNSISESSARSMRSSAHVATAVAAEEKKQAWLRDRLTEHKQLIDRNQAQMDAVKTMKQATAAVAQMEQARKIVAGEESDLLAINRRLEELRGVLSGQNKELAGVEAEQESARAEVATERVAISRDLDRAKVERAEGCGARPRGAAVEIRSHLRGRKRVEAVAHG